MTFTFLLTAPVGEILGLQWVLGAGAQPFELEVLYIIIQIFS